MLACAALATGMSPALAAETLTMVTTGKGSAQQWPIFIAIAKGYMGENGVTLDLVGTSSTAAAMQQLAARSANIASGGLTDPLRAIDKGAPISLLRVEAQVPPYTLWAKPTIQVSRRSARQADHHWRHQGHHAHLPRTHVDP